MTDKSYDETEDIPVDRPMGKSLSAIWDTRLNRRGFLKSSTSTLTVVATGLALPGGLQQAAPII